MRTIHTLSLAPRKDSPARKLAAATRAIIEPVEARLMMSITPATEQVAAITAKFETTPVSHSGDAADDPAVWVNPTDASLSTIIGTDKLGALNVYDLNGQLLQSITGTDFNNVDVRGNLVAASNRDASSVSIFRVDPATGRLTNVSARTITKSVSGEIYGLAMYQSAESGKTYVFINTKSGNVEQFELVENFDGKVDGKSVRKFSLGSITEGMVADDEAGALYVGQEDVAIWKYGAEPTDGTVRTQVDKVGSGGHLVADVEGLALYKAANGTGYLIASSQGSNDYVVYDRQTGEYVTRFSISGNSTIDGTNGTDGIEVISGNFGGDLSEGMFIAQDTNNTGGNQNFKVVSWGDIARAQAIPLVIDGAQNPPQVSNPDTGETPTDPGQTPTAPVVTNPAAPTISELQLVDGNTGEVLQTLTDGSVVDLSQYAGKKLNIAAIISPSKGSVVFDLDGSRFQVENYAPYRMAGDSGTISLTGTHSITATTYNERFAAGEVGNVYTINVTFSDGTTVTPPSTTPTPTVSAPATPTGVSAQANGADSITLSWNAVSGAQGYVISRSTNGTTYTEIRTQSGTSFSDSNLADSTKYYYKVSAYNTAGSSALSAAATATTQEAIDTTPIDDIVTEITGQPSAQNTGTTGALTSVSNFKAQSGKTYSNLIIKGMVDLRGITNVKFVNCVFDAAGSGWAVRCDDSASSESARVFQNCEMKNMKDEAVYGGGFSAISCYVHHSGGDGFKPKSNVLIQGCYVTMLGMSEGAHADGVQIRGHSNIRIIGNFFDMPKDLAGTSSNAGIFLQLSDTKNVTIDGNWFIGGNYTVCCYDVNAASNIKVTNNTFYVGSARYGFGNIFDGVVWSGNVTDTGITATTKMK